MPGSSLTGRAGRAVNAVRIDSSPMKNLFLAATAALLLSGLVFGQAKTEAKSKLGKAERELLQLEREWNEALRRVDIPTLDRILADDYIATTDGGVTFTKKASLESLKTGEDVIESAVAEEIKVSVYGEAAVLTGKWVVKEKAKGRDVSGSYRFTDTWVRRHGHWQCVADHFSKITPEK